MANGTLKAPHKLLAKVVAAAAIALFWCISAVGTTVGTTVGVTGLATAVNMATSTPAEAYRYWRRGYWGRPYYRRRYWRRRWRRW